MKTFVLNTLTVLDIKKNSAMHVYINKVVLSALTMLNV